MVTPSFRRGTLQCATFRCRTPGVRESLAPPSGECMGKVMFQLCSYDFCYTNIC